MTAFIQYILLSFIISTALLAQSQPVDLVEEGAMFVPQMKVQDVQVILDAASSDPFGLHDQIFSDPKDNPFLTIDIEFGPSLVRPAPSISGFTNNIKEGVVTFTIDEEGRFIIEEKVDIAKKAYGRKHTFANWSFSNFHLAQDYIFLEVKNSSLPKTYQGFHSDNANTSLVVLKTNDVINYMGTRRLILSIMPLPSSIASIQDIHYQNENEGGRNNPALSHVLGRTFKSGGYTITDTQGQELWIPEHLPDIYSDLSRLMIRGLSAAVAPTHLLKEELSPTQLRYLRHLSNYMEKQSESHSDAFQQIIERFLENQKGPLALRDVPFDTALDFSRTSYTGDLEAPSTGGWFNQAYGRHKPDSILVAEAHNLLNTKGTAWSEKKVDDFMAKWDRHLLQGSAADTRLAVEIKAARDIVESPAPTPEEIKNAMEAQSQIRAIRDRVFKSKHLDVIAEALKGDLGNAIGALGLYGLLYSFYTYTSFGGWAENIFEGVRAHADMDVLMGALRVNGAIVLGWFGTGFASLYLINKAVNKIKGTNRSFWLVFGEVGKWKTLALNFFPSKFIMQLIYPRYATTIYQGAVPSRENAGKDLRFERSLRNINTFIQALFKRHVNQAPAGNSAIAKTLTDSEPEEVGLKMLKRIKETSLYKTVLGGTRIDQALQYMEEQIRRRNITVSEMTATEGRLNKNAKELVLFKMVPIVAERLQLSELEIISALASSAYLFEEVAFVAPSEKFLLNLLKSGKESEYKTLWQAHQQRVDALNTRKNSIFLKYLLYRENNKLYKQVRKSHTYIKQAAEFKSIFYLALHSIHQEMAAADSHKLSDEKINDIFTEALATTQAMEKVGEGFNRVALRTKLQVAIDFHTRVYWQAKQFAQKGINQRQFVALSRIDEDAVHRMKRQVSLDYFFERIQSFAEFFKPLKEMGKSFYANPGEFFSEGYVFGLYFQDARHALRNSWDWMVTGPLDSANLINRASNDAIDRGVQRYGFFYKVGRQFASSKRFRQLQAFNRTMLFEFKRNFTRRLRTGLVYATLTQLAFYHQIRPDVYFTSLVMYGPILFGYMYIESKLMHATGIARYNREEYMEEYTARIFKTHGVNSVEALPAKAKWAYYYKNAKSFVNPHYYFIVTDLLLFNALTFFFERWSYLEGGIVPMMTGKIGQLFDRPEWQFSLQDVWDKALIPNAPEILTGTLFLWGAKKAYDKIKRKTLSIQLLNQISNRCNLLKNRFRYW